MRRLDITPASQGRERHERCQTALRRHMPLSLGGVDFHLDRVSELRGLGSPSATVSA